jgi:ligand-binding sensor domain-containing protein
MRTKVSIISAVILLIIAASSTVFAVGESAVITLVFPPGARATGLGEAFVGLADDASATFYNPAGLGQTPLANGWKAFLSPTSYKITAITSKATKDFTLKEKIWLGTAKGVMQYDGSAWQTYEKYLVLPDDNLDRVVRKFISIEDPERISLAVAVLRDFNKIESNRVAAVTTVFSQPAYDSLFKAKKVNTALVVSDIFSLAKYDRNESGIFGILNGKIDSVTAQKLSDTIAPLLDIPDVSFDDKVELKIPYTIAVNDSVSCMVTDGLERVWIGTPNGLWRYDGVTWSLFSTADGLPSNNITSVAIGANDAIAVGTTLGGAILSDGKWAALTKETGLPLTMVTALAFGKPGILYIGTEHGVIMKTDSTWMQFDTSNGLLSNYVTALCFDSHNQLWVGGANGIAMYDETAWKRYKFPGSIVSCIADYNGSAIWIGTNKGVVTYIPGDVSTDNSGKIIRKAPEWKTMHSKSGLAGDDVTGIAMHGSDIWISTAGAINQYAQASAQILTFYEQLLPAFKISDLWHFYIGATLPTNEWGTLGFTVNFINFGENDLQSETGQYMGKVRSWEGVFGLCYGLSLSQTFSLGLNIKYAHSALAPGAASGGVGRTFAIDAGLLKRSFLLKDLDVGLNLQNMGPSIFYVSQEQRDPIPFTLKLGSAYHLVKTPIHSVTVLLDLNREIVKTYSDGTQPDPFWKAIWTGFLHDTTATPDTSSQFIYQLEQVNLNAGIEYWYANFLALRIGHLFDYVGKRFELTLGLGLKYANFNFDCSFIHSPGGFMKGIVGGEGSNGSRNGQWRMSLLGKI